MDTVLICFTISKNRKKKKIVIVATSLGVHKWPKLVITILSSIAVARPDISHGGIMTSMSMPKKGFHDTA